MKPHYAIHFVPNSPQTLPYKGEEDERKPSGWDWFCAIFYPLEIISYHWNRSESSIILPIVLAAIHSSIQTAKFILSTVSAACDDDKWNLLSASANLNDNEVTMTMLMIVEKSWSFGSTFKTLLSLAFGDTELFFARFTFRILTFVFRISVFIVAIVVCSRARSGTLHAKELTAEKARMTHSIVSKDPRLCHPTLQGSMLSHTLLAMLSPSMCMAECTNQRLSFVLFSFIYNIFNHRARPILKMSIAWTSWAMSGKLSSANFKGTSAVTIKMIGCSTLAIFIHLIFVVFAILKVKRLRKLTVE